MELKSSKPIRYYILSFHIGYYPLITCYLHYYMLLTRRLLFFVIGYLSAPLLLQAQAVSDRLPAEFNLQQCYEYAMKNQSAVRQALLNKSISEQEIKATMAAWYPQISAQYNLQHYLQLPTTILPDFSDLASGRRVAVQTGVANTSNMLLQADQTLYSNDILLACRAARFSRLQFDQNTENTKINTVVNVSKAFYDIIFTREQLRILDENITRQQKQYGDALNRYKSGLVDKTDYLRASISLANTRSGRKIAVETIKAKYAYLKELMGIPVESLAALYESWSVPFSVLLAVPLGAFGAIVALMLLPKLSNNVYAQIGLITLIGLAAKNAILIVEFAKERVDRGVEIIEATIEAVKLRLRPIIMTSLAFILGVLPLAFSSGAGAVARQTIGWTVVGGMTAATFVAIFAVPVLYIAIIKFAYGKKKLAALQAQQPDNLSGHHV